MRSKALYWAMMALMLGGGDLRGSGYDELSEGEKEYLRQRIEANRKQRLLKQGVKEWNIDGFSIMARDEKNAIRKVNNFKKVLDDLPKEIQQIRQYQTDL